MANFAYRVFSEVAKQKTFVSAANVLNVTPSAISHSISGLEEELGFALFVRNRTGIMLTPDGEKVLPLYKDRIYCVAPEGFVPENGKTVVASDVCDETFILQQIDYDRDTKKALDAFHVSLNSIQYSIDDASIIAMVESGLGFGILPELALQKLSGRVVCYPFDGNFYRTICLVSHAKSQQTPSTQVFIEEVQTYLDKRYGKKRL